MSNVRLLVSYDGTCYLGWQKTAMGPSIEGVLEGVLSQILQEPIKLEAASRTDRGVHAEGQVVHFCTPKELPRLDKLKHSVNGLLPKDIVVTSMEEASLSFHPTLDSRGKEYHYFLCNSPVQLPFDHAFSWHFPSSLNLDKMRKGAALLLGQHDFSAFCNDHALSCKNPLCHLSYFEIHPLQGDRFCFILRGDRFLYKMVRNLVGTLVYVGCGKLEVDYLPTLLEKKKRALGGVTAPAHGLLLKRVFYADEK